MAKLVFKGLKPISINSAYYRNRKMTVKAKQFRSKFLSQLESQLDKLLEIQSQFDALKHCLSVSYVFHVPKKFFFTKKGELSLRSQDLDNCLKLVQDFIFNDKYENLKIDDKFIQELHAKKVPANEYRLEVEISILDLPNR